MYNNLANMLSIKQYKLFISHSWAYSKHYNKLIEWLDDSSITYKNYSVPKESPIHNAPTDKALRDAINEQIRQSNIILIMAGVYSTHSKWINIEIEIAKNYSKPIIAITPWGAERISLKVSLCANKVVAWQSSSIISAIKELA